MTSKQQKPATKTNATKPKKAIERPGLTEDEIEEVKHFLTVIKDKRGI